MNLHSKRLKTSDTPRFHRSIYPPTEAKGPFVNRIEMTRNEDAADEAQVLLRTQARGRDIALHRQPFRSYMLYIDKHLSHLGQIGNYSMCAGGVKELVNELIWRIKEEKKTRENRGSSAI